MTTTQKSPLGPFLAANPFPHPLTDGLFYREKMRAIHRIAPAQLNDGRCPPRVLEVGGGRSGLSSLLYPNAAVTTLDRDMSQLSRGHAAVQVCGDACGLPFPDGSFDAVTLFDVLEHIVDDRLAVGEALRVTRSGGWVLLSTPNHDWRYPYYSSMRRWCPPETQLMSEWGHVRRGYTRQALIELFGAAPQCWWTFVNPLTAFYHDVAFSRLSRYKRAVLYALAAPLTLAGYLMHGPQTPGTETVFTWQRE